LRNSVVRDVGGGGAEPNGVVLRGGGGPVLLEDNTIDTGDESRSGSAVLLAADPSGPDGSVVVRGNVLGGGRWILVGVSAWIVGHRTGTLAGTTTAGQGSGRAAVRNSARA